MKRIIHLRLTRKEADALMDAGNRGISDLIDSQTDEDLDIAEVAEAVMRNLGAEMYEAEWHEPLETKP